MNKNTKTFFSIFKLLNILGVFALIFALVACSGLQEKEEEPTGSLIRTFTLVDEYGRKSGTLKIDPFGDIELYDADGKLIRKLTNMPAPGNKPAAEPD